MPTPQLSSDQSEKSNQDSKENQAAQINQPMVSNQSNHLEQISSKQISASQNKSPNLLHLTPKETRPRERLLSRGVQSLTDIELLAIILRTGTQGMNVLQLSEKLLEHCGNLRGLFSASRKKLCQLKGVGEASFSQIQAIGELNRRYLAQKIRLDSPLRNPADTKKYLSSILRDKTREVFYVLLLDSQHRVIHETALFEGTVNAANIYPREVLKLALAYNAVALIIAHNHPSGVAEPSQADRDITKKLIEASALIDVTILDHIVIGDGVCVSFAQRGWL